MTDSVAYFNNAAKARFAPSVVATGLACLQKDPWLMSADGDKEKVRELYARIVGAKAANDIAIMPSTCFAITLAAQNLKDSTGKVLLIQDQYPSAVYPFQDICKASDGSLSMEIVPYPKENDNWTQLILDRLANDDISIACLPPLHWSDGTLIDLDTIGPVCKAKGIVLIVDATQASGILPVQVQRIQPAMLCSSVHK
jgi:selenocysteine lyase/cysteine desulfurase